MTTEMTNAEALAVLDKLAALPSLVINMDGEQVSRLATIEARAHFAALAQRVEEVSAENMQLRRLLATRVEADRLTEANAAREAAEARAAELKAEADAWRRKHRKQSKLRAKWRDEAMALRAGRVEPPDTP